ncbi:MAG TPA: arylsulfotransferase family protein [Polyangia bacterium]|jgi:hypothetical protein|nr:arylsulfotransferase family protein [Polyangia bacterium]
MLFKPTSFLVCCCLGFIVACAAGPSGTGTGTGGAAATGTGGATATGTGGSPGTGGTTGSGGFTGSGGTTGTGGSSGSGGGGTSDGGTGDAASVVASCTFSNVAATISPRISTVGIVTWATSLAGLTSARIEFGLTTAYGMTAPVDPTAAGYRTLLLGMKAEKMYHYRIIATGGAGTCTSGDYTVMTGAKPNGIPTLTVSTKNADKLAGGFLVTGESGQGAGAYIFDADAEVVWRFSIGGDVSSARMSYDGQYMWISNVNCCAQNGASKVHRVSMDGMTDENLSSQFVGQNHQLTVLPDETVAFYGYTANGCDDVKERAPNGTVKTIVNAQKAEGTTGGCHLNTIQYSRVDDALIFSDLNHNNYTKITRTGQTVWVLGGSTSQFGANLWNGGQHGLDILGVDRILIFNNGAGSAGSIAIEWKLTLTGTKSAMRAWSYAAVPAINVQIMGDVQRLPNGNTIVAYSTRGALHEVAADGTLLQSLSWPLGGTFGYIEKRASLYGPPPK